MPNRISIHTQLAGNQSNGGAKTKQISDVATTTTTRYTKNKVSQPQPLPPAAAQQQQQKPQQQQPTNILNVAEMLLHGVADHEILDIWLQSISCQECTANFQRAGYDMPTISRITPQDLTAIGITDPTKRLKILSEIKKLNLQDGIPNFRPSSLSHWLSLLRLDYFESLCDQQIDTIDKMCQLTWEDFEELGITKLGHQKRLLLAIEKMKELSVTEAKPAISEPIYDTNPSQILLVASAENHSMNGPIINKQSSTSELSSTGSGSMHSVYSANSSHYQPNYATMPSIVQQPDINQQASQQQKQAIYSQLPPPQVLPQPSPLNFNTQHNSHYQSSQPMNTHPIYDTNTNIGRNTMIPQTNRQSIGQLPFSALANLPKHQIQQLQQSSIYATLSRQPQRAKQPPPPVPIRTNSLTSNSLVDSDTNRQQMGPPTSALMRSGTRVSNRNHYNSQTLLSKNKSFSGNAYMEAARARFLDRNHSSQQCMANQIGLDQSNPHLIYGTTPSNFINRNLANGNHTYDGDNVSVYSRHSLATTASVTNSQSTCMTMRTPQYQQNPLGITQVGRSYGNDYDTHSDTNSTKSLMLQTSNSGERQTSSSQDSGSSQTLYNSASSGSNDQNLNSCNIPHSAEMVLRHSTASSATLNDVNLILENQQSSRFQQGGNTVPLSEDADFPPPPSPLSLTDSDEHDLLSLNTDKNFTDMGKGLMAFRIGT